MFKAILKTVFALILTVSFAQAADYGTLKKIHGRISIIMVFTSLVIL